MNSVFKLDRADARATTAAALAKTDARASANDDTAAVTPATTRNPLWIIAIGMACFFAVVIAVMAQSTGYARSASPTPTPVVATPETATHP